MEWLNDAGVMVWVANGAMAVGMVILYVVNRRLEDQNRRLLEIVLFLLGEEQD